MAITDTEREQIVNEILEQIQNNGLNFQGTPITLPSDIDEAEEDRQKVFIPGIDMRNATPVYGNLNLENLLNAYGLTKVEEIASDISSNYMKKVADSDLNMNGHDITNANVNVATHMTLGTEGNSYGGYQITTSEQLDSFIETGKVMWAKVTQDASPVGNDGIVLSIGWRKDSTRGYCRQLFFDEANHNIYSRGQSNGVWRDWLPIVGNQSSAINAMGSNYIRYENGLQICWGTATATGTSVEFQTNWQRINLANPATFPVSFSAKPYCSAHTCDGDPVVVGRTIADTSKITNLYCWYPQSFSSITFNYVAIGKWK